MEEICWSNDVFLKEYDLDVSAKFPNKEAYFEDFMNRYFEPKKFKDNMGRIYLAMDNEGIVGMVSLIQTNPGIVELKRNYITPEFRGKGIAKSLLSKLISDAKNMGHSAIVLDSAHFMKPAHNLYRSFGFKEAEPFKGAESSMDNVQAIFMKLDLECGII